MLAKLMHGAVFILASVFFIIYVCLLFPALVYMPVAGTLIFTNEEMTVVGGVACIAGMLTVPFSMGSSLYFICSSCSAKKYLKVLFFCLLPIMLLLLNLFFMNFMNCLHNQ